MKIIETAGDAKMSFDTRRAEALAMLEKTGVWRSSYSPPLTRLLWRIGVRVPPPHFCGFSTIVLLYLIYFTIGWGVLSWLWQNQNTSPIDIIIASLVAGIIFGVSMASYYAHGRHKYNLPSWQSLG